MNRTGNSTVIAAHSELDRTTNQIPDDKSIIEQESVGAIQTVASEPQSAMRQFGGREKAKTIVKPTILRYRQRMATEPWRSLREDETDYLDQLAALSGRVRPYSPAAVAVATAAVLLATILHLLGGWPGPDLRFGIYVAAVFASGLLAGLPAATGAAISALLIVGGPSFRRTFL